MVHIATSISGKTMWGFGSTSKLTSPRIEGAGGLLPPSVVRPLVRIVLFLFVCAVSPLRQHVAR